MGLFLSQNCFFLSELQKAAPDTTQQASSSEGDNLTPSPTSSLTAGTDLAEEDGCGGFPWGKMSTCCHPTQRQPSDWGFLGA